jgi:hypothetical protein
VAEIKLNSEMYLEGVIERVWRSIWRPRSSNLEMHLVPEIKLNSEMHLEAEIKLNTEMHLEAVFERV